jgi:hypothetical protein
MVTDAGTVRPALSLASATVAGAGAGPVRDTTQEDEPGGVIVAGVHCRGPKVTGTAPGVNDPLPPLIVTALPSGSAPSAAAAVTTTCAGTATVTMATDPFGIVEASRPYATQVYMPLVGLHAMVLEPAAGPGATAKLVVPTENVSDHWSAAGATPVPAARLTLNATVPAVLPDTGERVTEPVCA